MVAAAEAETATAGGDFDAEDAAGEGKQSDEALPPDLCKPGLGPLHLRLKAVVDALCEFQEAADSDRKGGTTRGGTTRNFTVPPEKN